MNPAPLTARLPHHPHPHQGLRLLQMATLRWGSRSGLHNDPCASHSAFLLPKIPVLHSPIPAALSRIRARCHPTGYHFNLIASAIAFSPTSLPAPGPGVRTFTYLLGDTSQPTADVPDDFSK